MSEPLAQGTRDINGPMARMPGGSSSNTTQHNITVEHKSATMVSGFIAYCSCAWFGKMHPLDNGAAELEGHNHSAGRVR